MQLSRRCGSTTRSRPGPRLLQSLDHRDRRTLAQVAYVRFGGRAPGKAIVGCSRPWQAASTCSATQSGVRLFTCRAAWMNGVRSGVAWAINHGSTAMQWPSTPGPGCRMSTRGWRLASSISSHGSIPRKSPHQRNLVRERDVDVPVRVLGELHQLRGAGRGRMAPAADEEPTEPGSGGGTCAGDAADDPIVVRQLAEHVSRDRPVPGCTRRARRSPPRRSVGTTGRRATRRARHRASRSCRPRTWTPAPPDCRGAAAAPGSRGSPQEPHVRGVIRSVGRRHCDEKDIRRPVSAMIRSASVPTNRTVPGRERYRPLNSFPGHMPFQVACPTARLYKWYPMPHPQSRVRRTRYPFPSRRQLHEDGPGAGPGFPTTHRARHRKRPRASPCLHPARHYELFRLQNTPPTTEDICSLWLRPTRSPTSLVRINTVSDWIDP